MTYQQNYSQENHCECEFTIPIKLNVPITINSQVYINHVPKTKQTLPVVIQPDLILEPEVKDKPPTCYPKINGYESQNGQQEYLMSSVEMEQ